MARHALQVCLALSLAGSLGCNLEAREFSCVDTADCREGSYCEQRVCQACECDGQPIANGQCIGCELFCDADFADCDGDPGNGCECQPGMLSWERNACGLDDDPSQAGFVLAGSGIFGQKTIWSGLFDDDLVIARSGPTDNLTLSFEGYAPPYALVQSYDEDGVFLRSPREIRGSSIASWFIEEGFVGGQFQELSVGGGDLSASGRVDGFVAGVDQNTSAVRWASQISTNGADRVFAGATLSDQSVIVGGVACEGYQTTCASMEINAGQSDAMTFENRGLSDGFVARFRPDGTLAWGQAIGGPGDDRVIALAMVNADEHVAMVGDYEGPNTLGDGQGAQTLTSPRPNAFAAVYDSDGELLWAFSPTTSGSARALAVTSAGARMFVLLRYSRELSMETETSEIVLNGGDDSLALIAFSADEPGKPLWARTIASGSLATGELAKPLADMTAIQSGIGVRVFVTSAISNTTEFAPGAPNATRFADVEGTDLFVGQFDGKNGDLLWVKRSTGPAEAFATTVVPLDSETVLVGGGRYQDSERLAPEAPMIRAGCGFVARFESITP